jgi:hypothetical protein
MAGPVGENPRVRECRAGPGQPSVTDPARHPHGGRLIDRECRARPGRPSVTDPARHPHSRRECRAEPGRPERRARKPQIF